MTMGIRWWDFLIVRQQSLFTERSVLGIFFCDTRDQFAVVGWRVCVSMVVRWSRTRAWSLSSRSTANGENYRHFVSCLIIGSLLSDLCHIGFKWVSRLLFFHSDIFLLFVGFVFWKCLGVSISKQKQSAIYQRTV